MSHTLSLQVLHENEDVIGAFVADGQKIICSCLPDSISESQVNVAIEVCDRSIIGTRISSFATERIVYYLQQSILLVQHVVDHVFLFVVCKPIEDLPLLDIYINIMVDEIKTYLLEKTTEDELPSISDLKNGMLKDLYDPLQTWLAQILGPVAGMVLDDAIDSWISDGNPVREHLDALFQKLDEDLDIESQKVLRTKFKSYL
jgi:hypothetical protein